MADISAERMRALTCDVAEAVDAAALKSGLA